MVQIFETILYDEQHLSKDDKVKICSYFLLAPQMSQSYSKDICIHLKTKTHEDRENGRENKNN